MNKYWRTYLKNGRLLSFGNQVHYIDIRDNSTVLLKESRLSGARTFAIIPIDNILWIESIDPSEGEE